MNQELISRIKTAGEYQKKAIYALFPEQVGRHLNVIEQELKMMALEMFVDLMADCKKKDDGGNSQGHNEEPVVKKVPIG